MEIDIYNYKTFRGSIWGDRLIKLINLMLRSAECGIKGFQGKNCFILKLNDYKRRPLLVKKRGGKAQSFFSIV